MNSILRPVFVVILLAVGACTPSSQSAIGAEEFTALYAEELRRLSPELSVRTAGYLEVSIERAGQQLTAYLDNAYASYLNDPAQLEVIIDDYAAGIVETIMPSTAAIDASRIVPVIRHLSFVEAFGNSRGTEPGVLQTLAFDRYNDDLVILYAEDTPRTIRYLDESDLAESGIPREEARQRATDNLRALLPEPKLALIGSIYAFQVGGIYESSILLFDDFWASGLWRDVPLTMVGDPVIAVPSRSFLLVAGSQDPEGINLLRTTAENASVNEPYPISDQLFIYRDDRFQPFEG